MIHIWLIIFVHIDSGQYYVSPRHIRKWKQWFCGISAQKIRYRINRLLEKSPWLILCQPTIWLIDKSAYFRDEYSPTSRHMCGLQKGLSEPYVRKQRVLHTMCCIKNVWCINNPYTVLVGTFLQRYFVWRKQHVCVNNCLNAPQDFFFSVQTCVKLIICAEEGMAAHQGLAAGTRRAECSFQSDSLPVGMWETVVVM